MDKVVLNSSNKLFCMVFYEIAVNEVIKCVKKLYLIVVSFDRLWFW